MTSGNPSTVHVIGCPDENTGPGGAELACDEFADGVIVTYHVVFSPLGSSEKYGWTVKEEVTIVSNGNESREVLAPM